MSAPRLRLLPLVFSLVGAVGCSCDTLQIRKHRDTLHVLTAFAQGLEAYKEAQGEYPRAIQGDFEPSDLGLDTSGMPAPQDAWRRQLQYVSSGNSYLLWSKGADGLTDAKPAGNGQANFDSDVILFNGQPWQWLEGLTAIRQVEHDPFGQVQAELSRLDSDAV